MGRTRLSQFIIPDQDQSANERIIDQLWRSMRGRLTNGTSPVIASNISGPSRIFRIHGRTAYHDFGSSIANGWIGVNVVGELNRMSVMPRGFERDMPTRFPCLAA